MKWSVGCLAEGDWYCIDEAREPLRQLRAHDDCRTDNCAETAAVDLLVGKALRIWREQMFDGDVGMWTKGL
jgi:hypothetical protein